MSQGKSKTMPMQIFLGVEAVYYGIVQVENNWSMRPCVISPTNTSHIIIIINLQPQGSLKVCNRPA